ECSRPHIRCALAGAMGRRLACGRGRVPGSSLGRAAILTVLLRNFGGERMNARRVVSASTAMDVRDAVLRARSEGCRIRPLGTRFTISDVSIDDDVLLLGGELPSSPPLLTPPSGRRFVRVPASATIARVMAFLE